MGGGGGLGDYFVANAGAFEDLAMDLVAEVEAKVLMFFEVFDGEGAGDYGLDFIEFGVGFWSGFGIDYAGYVGLHGGGIYDSHDAADDFYFDGAVVVSGFVFIGFYE